MTGHDQTGRPPDCGQDAAPYLLGALAHDEARAFVRHMQRCAVRHQHFEPLAHLQQPDHSAAPT